MSACILNSLLQSAGNTSFIRSSWSGEEEAEEAAPPPALLQPPSEVSAAEG